MTQLTYRQAAARVGRSVRTIKRWRKGGMRMTLHNGFRVVDEAVLLAWWRARLTNWPPHQYRMRALLAAQDAPAPENTPEPAEANCTRERGAQDASGHGVSVAR